MAWKLFQKYPSNICKVQNTNFFLTNRLQKENIFRLYSQFGENYFKVLENTAVDILTEEATKYTAYEFFWDRGVIKDDFQVALDNALAKTCFANIQFLQLKTVDLPDAFENAIQLSEVKKQDIQKAIAELNKVRVEVDTLIKSADYQKNVTINYAEGDAEAIIRENQASVDSLREVQDSQIQAYKKLKDNIGLDNTSLLSFMKAKVVKGFNGENMALSIDSPIPKVVK